MKLSPDTVNASPTPGNAAMTMLPATRSSAGSGLAPEPSFVQYVRTWWSWSRANASVAGWPELLFPTEMIATSGAVASNQVSLLESAGPSALSQGFSTCIFGLCLVRLY